MTETIRVNLGERGYRIAIQADSLSEAGARIRVVLGSKPRNAVLISNHTVHTRYGAGVEKSLAAERFKVHRLLIGDGERFKTLKTAESLYTSLIENRIERSDVIVGLGGGVIGDLAGFVAATYLRGLPLVHVPTTLLAQIDSSIGGKTGVNHRLGKNLIGAFYQPSLVLIDPCVLATLPARELRSGLYEAIKYGVIRDRRLFDWVVRNKCALESRQAAELAYLITACCKIKVDVVERDEKEGGLRQILNFGHTVGHALESVTNYKRFRHGEAVGYGMMAAGRIAELTSMFAPGDRQALDEVVFGLGRLPNTGSIASDDIMFALRRDKKVSSGRLVFVLPVRIGQVVIRDDVPLREVSKAVKSVLALNC